VPWKVAIVALKNIEETIVDRARRAVAKELKELRRRRTRRVRHAASVVPASRPATPARTRHRATQEAASNGPAVDAVVTVGMNRQRREV
jgi:hypothetical protein